MMARAGPSPKHPPRDRRHLSHVAYGLWIFFAVISAAGVVEALEVLARPERYAFGVADAWMWHTMSQARYVGAHFAFAGLMILTIAVSLPIRLAWARLATTVGVPLLIGFTIFRDAALWLAGVLGLS